MTEHDIEALRNAHPLDVDPAEVAEVIAQLQAENAALIEGGRQQAIVMGKAIKDMKIERDTFRHGHRIMSENCDLLSLMLISERSKLQSITDPENQPNQYGVQVVPVEPTHEMFVAFAETWFSKVRPIDDCGMEDAYAAMLAAAPKAIDLMK